MFHENAEKLAEAESEMLHCYVMIIKRILCTLYSRVFEYECLTTLFYVLVSAESVLKYLAKIEF